MYWENIKKQTIENTNFRKVLYTGSKAQLVVMNIPVGGDIGEEAHPSTDQIIFIVEGEAEAVLNGEKWQIAKDDVVYVPEGVEHNFTNVGDKDLKLFTVYAPSEHPDGTVHKTKMQAVNSENQSLGRVET